jgi:hypothetical protein
MKYGYCFFLLFFLFSTSNLSAQDEQLKYINYTYLENIRTVNFHPKGLVLGNPILELNAPTQLYLSFDDLSEEVKNYTYTVVHCNADWQPSDLTENEYINGFLEDDIENFDFSFNTVTPFTNYNVSIPNQNMAFTKSGNYLLKVYEDEDDRRLAITRRFVVVEPMMQVQAQMVRPSKVFKSNTHQEIDFVVTHESMDIRNPRSEIRATVLQNFRWDNAVTDLEPLFIKTKQVGFDLLDKIVFEAGKEFRAVDLRSFRFPSARVYDVQGYDDGFDITLLPEEKRSNKAYLQFEDVNGRYVIESLDRDDPDLDTDYANVMFTLRSPTEYYGQDMYLFGALTEWMIKPEFKMTYNDRMQAYTGEFFLKQGYYNYMFVLSGEEQPTPDWKETEGNWFEAGNEYTILVYYRPFGSRFDRLVAVRTLMSRQ